MEERSPVRLTAVLDPRLSRGLWLIKWLLAIPHYVVLVFLWIAFFVLTVVAFFAILFTGRYPHTIFEFNRGVLRWTWRVSYYSYGVLGTDRYPPFTLHDVPDYPARLDIAPPGRLSRGLVLVKWWLLAIPHYLVVAFFVGGGLQASSNAQDDGSLLNVGLIALLVFFALVALLFTARYPKGIFDFVVGMHRWGLRVLAYSALMTDVYPPFRLDQGGEEPEGALAAEPESAAIAAPPPVPPAEEHPVARWSAGPVLTLVAGAFAALLAAVALTTGIVSTAVDRTKSPDGYVQTDMERAAGTGYALTAEDIEIEGQGVRFLRENVGTVRFEARSTGKPLFVGIASQADVNRYLAGVDHDRISHVVFSNGDEDVDLRHEPGGAAPAPPGSQSFWVAKTSGPGTQRLTWKVQEGDWAVVVMNADASRAVIADLRLGATLPGLTGLATAMYVTAAVLFVLGAILIFVAVRVARRPA